MYGCESGVSTFHHVSIQVSLIIKKREMIFHFIHFLLCTDFHNRCGTRRRLLLMKCQAVEPRGLLAQLMPNTMKKKKISGKSVTGRKVCQKAKEGENRTAYHLLIKVLRLNLHGDLRATNLTRVMQ